MTKDFYGYVEKYANYNGFELDINDIELHVKNDTCEITKWDIDGLEKPNIFTLLNTYTDDDIKIYNNFKSLRNKRNILLNKTDYKLMTDYLYKDDNEKQKWIDYRQALRDLPLNTIDPENPVWPTPPE